MFWTPQLTATFILFCVSLWTIVVKTLLRKSCTHANVINLEVLQFRSCGMFYLLYSAFKVYRLNKLSLEKHYSNLPSKYFQKCMCHSKVGQPFNNVLDSTFVLHSKSPRLYGFKRSRSNTERKPKKRFLFYVWCFDYKHNFNFWKKSTQI